MRYKKQNQDKYKIVSVIKQNECPFCKSKEIIKWRWRLNHTTKKQRWKCKFCSETFTADDGFLNLKHKREIVTNCISLFMSRMSLRKAVEHFNQFSKYKVGHMSILKWVWRYGRSLFSVYYNFIRIHQGIKMTPIEKAGVKLDLGQNKWLGLIYNASQKV